jgi:periplasmic protein TonB
MKNWKSLVIVTLMVGIFLPVATLKGSEVRKVKKTVQPKYPELALKMKVQGTVKVEAVVDSDGTVKNVIVVSGNVLLKPSVIDCVKQWQYEPGKDTALVPVEIDFKLPD